MAEMLDTFDNASGYGGFAVQMVLGNALGSIRAIRELPHFVRELARGELATLTRRFERQLAASGIHGMQLAMDYASGATADRLQLIEAQRTQALLDDSFNLPFPFVGEPLGVDDLGDDFRTPVSSDVPTLFCVGTLDGRTPISNAEDAKRGFPRTRT